MSQHWDMKTFMKGASILTISAIIVKILSAVYRVPYQNMVGDQGFYIYQQVYPFIGIFIIWTSYGFAVAVSKLLANYELAQEKKAIIQIAFYYLLVLSVMFFVLLTMSAPYLADAMGDAQLGRLLRASAYIVLVMPFLAVLKGHFQSTGNMIPVAVSGVGEQATRVVIVLMGTWIAMRLGASLYTAGEIAMWGAVVGETAGVLILAMYVQRTTKQPAMKKPIWPIIKELTTISIGVSASSLILLFFQLVDSFTILNSLVFSGIDTQLAMIQKGVYDRGQPLVQMGILIATTLALAIVPLIAHQSSQKSGRGAAPFIRVTYRVAFLFGIAATVGLILVLPYVNEMLFETRDGSVALMIFAVQILWLSLLLPLTAILQGAGKVKIPTLLFICGIVVKALSNIVLVPKFGIVGAAIASNIGFLVIVVGVGLYFKQVYPLQLASAKFYQWIGIATVSMIVVVIPWQLTADYWLFQQLSERVASTLIALTAVILGACIFIYIVLKSRIMKEKDWYLLPFGKRLARMQLFLLKKEGD